jgi:hypothetical protein
MKNNRQKFLTSKGLPEDTNLDLHQIASISGFPEDALKQVYRRATAAKPGAKDDPFKVNAKGKIVKKKPIKAVEGFTVDLAGKGKGYSRLYSFVMGKYGKDKDIAELYGMVQPTAILPEPTEPKDTLTLDSDGSSTDGLI